MPPSFASPSAGSGAGPGDVFLGLDVGTSSVKGVAVDGAGRVLAQAERPLPLSGPEPLAAEQDAEDWWERSVEVLRELAAAAGARVRALGLTGQKHALLPLDREGRALRPAMLWCDGRAAPEAREAERRVGRAALARKTGALALPGYLVPKWLWLSRREPDVVARTARLSFAKDFVRLRLTGEFATDRTEASASLLYDLVGKAWSADLESAFGVSPTLLPSVARSGDVAGRVSAEGAARTGLPEGTPVAAGAGDNEAGAVGCGATGDGRVAVVLGTSATIVGWHARHGTAGGLVWGRHAMRRGYAATGVVLSAGRALEWVRSVAFPKDMSVDEVLAAAQASDPKEGPLVFLPSLAGERSPVPDPDASGAFLGLRPGHTRGHLARAVLEGVAIAVSEVVGLLRGAGVPVSDLRLTGGGAASPFWRGLVSAAAAIPVRACGGTTGPALGAAILAARATVRGTTVASLASSWIEDPAPEAPDPARVERMRALAAGLRAARNAVRHLGGPRRPEEAGARRAASEAASGPPPAIPGSAPLHS
jgi:xylulokinase